jgi:hypothetical protein
VFPLDAPRSAASNLTLSGMPGLGKVPYGLHSCLLYNSPKQMLDIVVQFFRRGLELDEQCIWITASPVSVADVATALANYPDAARGLQSQRLLLYDAGDWYGPDPGGGAMERLTHADRSSIAGGRAGLRVAGTASPTAPWSSIMDYEASVGAKIASLRVVALCCYCTSVLEPTQLYEVRQAHDCALHWSDDEDWQILHEL